MVCRALVLLALTALFPGAALAGQVCPPASLNEPLPGASEVSLSLADVSTAAYVGSWQQGVIGKDGLQYRLFADGTGSVAADLRMRGWHVDFTCDLSQNSCRYESHDGAPKTALAAAREIGDCLTASPPKPKARPADPGKPKAKPDAAAQEPVDKAAPRVAVAKPGKATAKAPAAPVALPKLIKLAPPTFAAAVVAATDPAKAPPASDAKAATASAGPAAVPAGPALSDKAVLATAAMAAKDPTALPAPARETKTPRTAPDAADVAPIKAGPAKGRMTVQKAAKATERLSIPQTKAVVPAPRPDAKTLPEMGVALAEVPASGKTCRGLGLPDEPAPARVQRLLLLAGFDPGPIDGKWGAKTRAALAAALKEDSSAEATEGAIQRLERLLCAESGPAPSGQGGAARCP